MLNDRDVRKRSLQRIADALDITIDDLSSHHSSNRLYDQRIELMLLWDRLPSDELRAKALDAVRNLSQDTEGI